MLLKDTTFLQFNTDNMQVLEPYCQIVSSFGTSIDTLEVLFQLLYSLHFPYKFFICRGKKLRLTAKLYQNSIQEEENTVSAQPSCMKGRNSI